MTVFYREFPVRSIPSRVPAPNVSPGRCRHAVFVVQVARTPAGVERRVLHARAFPTRVTRTFRRFRSACRGVAVARSTRARTERGRARQSSRRGGRRRVLFIPVFSLYEPNEPFVFGRTMRATFYPVKKRPTIRTMRATFVVFVALFSDFLLFFYSLKMYVHVCSRTTRVRRLKKKKTFHHLYSKSKLKTTMHFIFRPIPWGGLSAVFISSLRMRTIQMVV